MQYYQAQNALFNAQRPIKHTHILPLLQAQNQILAQDIFSTKALPSFDNSAMDGYAFKVEDCGKTLRIVGSVLAGDCTERILNASECVKIMTGAKIPQGANCVVPFEDIAGGFSNTEQIFAPKALKPFANIKKEGEEIKHNTLLLEKNTRLNPESLTLLATQGISHITTYLPLDIAVFASGDELKETWESANAYQIYNSNATMTQTLLHSFGFKSRYCGILKDNVASIQNALEIPSDVIFTTGGASKGEADYIRKALERNGAHLLVNGIDIKPGKPIMIAQLKDKIIIALPGNPLASYVLLRTLILPFLLYLSGANAYHIEPIFLKAKSPLKRKNRTEILLGQRDGAFVDFTKGGKYGSSEVTPMAQSNALIVIDATYTTIETGDLLKVIPFTPTFSQNFQNPLNTKNP